MDDIRYRKISEYLWQIVLLILGVLFITISFFIKDTGKIFSTLNGIGVSLLLSGLLGFFVSALIFRKDKKYAACEKWGIKTIYQTRAIANLSIDAYQEVAKERVDIIAFGLGSWRQAKDRLIDSMLSQGVTIRIITMDPDNEFLKMRDRAEGKTEGSTRESILQLDQFFKQTESRKKVEIKHHDELPLDFYFRVDDHVFVGPYLFGNEGQQTITYEFEKGGEGFKYYTDYFEKLWSGKSIPSIRMK